MTEDGAGADRHDPAAAPAVDLGPGLRCTAATGSPLELTLEGSLTGEAVTRLHAALLDLDPSQAAQLTSDDIVVDVAGVDTVDVDALRLLVRLDSALDARGHTLRLRRPTPALLRVVAGAGLLDALPFTAT